jgi:hypothetical protein
MQYTIGKNYRKSSALIVFKGNLDLAKKGLGHAHISRKYASLDNFKSGSVYVNCATR